jgi:uncharacterized protein (TIGR03435 family)
MRRFFISLACTLACYAQAEFEVASVKPNQSMGMNTSMNKTPDGGLACVNVPLRMLIVFAYDIRDHQLSGGPPWMDSDRYDIMAKGSGGAGANDWAVIRQKVKALLADRFKLAVHTETKEQPIFALVVAKGGPHLEKSQTEKGPQIIGRTGIFTCKKITMQDFAERALGDRLGRKVIDKTGIAGEFDFQIKYVEERAAAAGEVGPDFLNAMQEQLGLKVESQKGSVEVIVIDHVEKASAN